MRTTVTIDDDLLDAAKRRAREANVTLSQVVSEALRVLLLRPAKLRKRKFKLVTHGGTGPRPGVDLDRTSALLEEDDLRQYGQRP